MVWTEQEVQILYNFYPKLGTKACKNMLPNKTINQIHNKSNRLGLRVDKSTLSAILSNASTQYNKKIDLSRFSIHNLDKYSTYILGLLWADGHVNKYSVTLSTTYPDSDEFTKILYNVGDWSCFKKQYQPTWKPSVSIKTGNKELASLLSNYGYLDGDVSKLIRFIDNIPDHIKHYWFLGLVDGDGSWYYNNKLWSRQFALCSDTDQDWSYLTKLLDYLNIRYTINSRVSKKGHKSSVVRFTGRSNCIRFGQYIYQNYEEDLIGLKRKFDIYLNISTT